MEISFTRQRMSHGELVIESKLGVVRVYFHHSSNHILTIENEDILPQLGLTVNDVLAMYFDLAKDQTFSGLFPLYRERLRNGR